MSMVRERTLRFCIVPINSTKQDSGRASKTGDRLIFAKKTAKINLSPQAWILPINSAEFLVFFDRSSGVNHGFIAWLAADI